MGKYYTIQANALYIYITNDESLIDVGLLPEVLGLFSVETTWRMCPWLMVSEGVSKEGLRIAEIFLKAHGYNSLDAGSELLNNYFLKRD